MCQINNAVLMESACYTPVIRLTWCLKTMPKDDWNGVVKSHLPSRKHPSLKKITDSQPNDDMLGNKEK